jgi:hypothetical protein
MILPTCYLGPISYFKLISENSEILIDSKENFIKQSYRNRCYIYGANGSLSLSIPLQKRKNHTPIENIKISYDESWQKMHWRSIESAYRTSPFFEFYEDDLKPFFESKEHTKLLKFNADIQSIILNLIKINTKIGFTQKYENVNPDWRQLIHPKDLKYQNSFQFPKYIQVFEEKYGFIPNLSILDVLFNLGPRTLDYLKSIEFQKQ